MDEPADPPHAVVVLRFADCTEATVGGIDGGMRCDLALVDLLLRLRLCAARRGVALELRDVDPALDELLELAGVRGLLRG